MKPETDPVPPTPPPDIGDPEATRSFLLAAALIVAGMVLWGVAMHGY
jgi:hypothetical protein